MTATTSSTWTLSPTCFCHDCSVPSVMESPMLPRHPPTHHPQPASQPAIMLIPLNPLIAWAWMDGPSRPNNSLGHVHNDLCKARRAPVQLPHADDMERSPLLLLVVVLASCAMFLQPYQRHCCSEGQGSPRHEPPG